MPSWAYTLFALAGLVGLASLAIYLAIQEGEKWGRADAKNEQAKKIADSQKKAGEIIAENKTQEDTIDELDKGTFGR